jgi:hypothetical protein
MASRARALRPRRRAPALQRSRRCIRKTRAWTMPARRPSSRAARRSVRWAQPRATGAGRAQTAGRRAAHRSGRPDRQGAPERLVDRNAAGRAVDLLLARLNGREAPAEFPSRASIT